MPATSPSLNDSHAVVTGASRGIGAAIAAALANEGARVSLLGRESASLERTAASVAAGAHVAGGAAASVAADVSDEGSVHSAFESARRRFGPIQVLINNAGQAASAKFTATDTALWRRMLEVNLTGTYLCCREAVPDMVTVGCGRIINIASTAGLRGAPYIAAYAASKHGVIGLTRSLALEYAARNITVNAICPGYTDTQIVRDAVANIVAKTGRSEAEALASLLATNPQRRLITPEEIAQCVLWLCRTGSESITAQSIVLAGGEVT